ncbi:hypothetical protein IAU60_002760 [Kwoniella sp. DSM 27419]
MLELYLTPRKGNSGGRFFPHTGHTGHLGVTPVVLQGKIATKLPEVCEPLLVKSVSLGIRCTESLGNGLYKVLWQKRKVIMAANEGDEYMSLGDWETTFKTTVPVDAALHARSTMCIPDYKVVWRLEVVIDHKPIPYVGTSISRAFNLNLHSHRSPATRPMSPPSPYVLGSEGCSANVCVSAHPGAFGPGDTLPIQVQVRPVDAGLAVKKASVVLERHLEYVERRAHTPPSQPIPESVSTSSGSGRFSGFFRSSQSPNRRSSEEDTSRWSRKDKVSEVSTSDISMDASGAHWARLSMDLPTRHGNWDLGETHQSDLVRISYTLKASVAVRPSKSRSSRTLTCAPVPIVIAATSIEDRANAAQLAAGTASKKRYRSSRRGLYMHEGNVDVTDSATGLLTASPVLSPITGVATDVKPILLPPNHNAGPAQSISFAFPQASSTSRESKPFAIESILNPSSSDSHLPSPPQTRQGRDINPLWRNFQANGRRISSTTSEEEEVQPSRSRQKTRAEGDHRTAHFERPSLPSLDALGLGLPHVPDDERPRSRPRTAPVHSTFAMAIPPPLSGTITGQASLTPFGQRPVTAMGKMGGDAGGVGPFTPSSIESDKRFAFAIPRTPAPLDME